MKWLVWALVVFAGAVALALLLRFNDGNVAVLWPPYRIDISVNLALTLVVLAFIALHLSINGLMRALQLPQKVREYRQRRQEQAASLALRDAVLAFFEGRLARAERFARSAEPSERTRAAAALVAARAAHRMQERERRDAWLRSAAQDADASAAVLMLQAEMAVEDRRTAEAIELLESIKARGARHIVALRADLRAREQAGQWEEMLRVLRLIEHRDALHPSAVSKLRQTAIAGLVSGGDRELSAIRNVLRQLKPEERQDPGVATTMGQALLDAGAPDEARRLLEPLIDQDVQAPCLAVWTRTCPGRERESIERVQAWRQRHGDLPELSLALGRVCVMAQLWGKAEEAFRDAERKHSDVQVQVALAELYERLERTAEAHRYFRLAARSSVANSHGL